MNWLVPGLGYYLCGDRRRSLALFFIINGCFAMGLFYGGFILTPVWSFRDPEFNIVSLLTYIAQGFHGGGWLLTQALHLQASESASALFNLHRMSAKAYSDLGVFHMVVAGGLNYFATVRLFDLLAGNPDLTGSVPEDSDEKSGQKSASESDAGAAPAASAGGAEASK